VAGHPAVLGSNWVITSDVDRGQTPEDEAEDEDKATRPRPRPSTKSRGRGQGRGQFFFSLRRYSYSK